MIDTDLIWFDDVDWILFIYTTKSHDLVVISNPSRTNSKEYRTDSKEYRTDSNEYCVNSSWFEQSS